MPLWLYISLWIIWVIYTIFIIMAVDEWRSPYKRPSSSGAAAFFTWVTLTPLWICWNIWG